MKKGSMFLLALLGLLCFSCAALAQESEIGNFPFFDIASADEGWIEQQKWYGSSPVFDVKIRSGTPSAVYDAYAEAMSDWYDADSRIRITGKSSSLNEVYAVDLACDANRGLTIPWPENGSTMQMFEIWINTRYPQGTNAYRSTAGHEFGHVLGLGHIDNYNVLMNTGRDLESIYTPTSRDIMGVLTIWGYM